MTPAMVRWQEARLEAAGLDWRAHPEWPVLRLADGGGIYQPVPDTGSTGVFFLRHGPGAELDGYVAALGDALTQARVLREEDALVGGRPGRMVEVALETAAHGVYHVKEDGGPVDETVPPPSTRIHVVGATSPGGAPVLVGYRVPADVPSAIEKLLRDMVSQVSFS